MKSAPLFSVPLCALGLVLAAWGALGAAPAPAAGGVAFNECVSGKLAVVKPFKVAEGACGRVRTTSLDAEGSGFNYPGAIAASADGRSVYAVSSRADSVASFAAKPLGLRECWSGNSTLRAHGRNPCRNFPHAGTEDAHTGFNGITFETLSPDGHSLYTVSNEGAIGVFSRARSGKLTFKGCLTGSTAKESVGRLHVCATIPSATDDYQGLGSGLGSPHSLTVSPDGRFVYVAAGAEAAITTFARAPSGALSFRGCLRGGSPPIFGFTSVCPLVAPEEGNRTKSGLAGVSRIAISRDGTSLYASAPRAGAVSEFRRDPASGALTFSGCISSVTRGRGPGDPCTLIPTSDEISFDTGMDGIKQLALSPDGTSLYGLATGDDAIASFSRSPLTGELAYQGCLTGDSSLGEALNIPNPCSLTADAAPNGAGSGLGGASDLIVSPSGKNLYLAAAKDAAIARLSRNPSGALHFASCLTGKPSAAQPAGPCKLQRPRRGAHQLGFAGLSSLAISGTNLYATATQQSAITRFKVSR